MNIRKLALTLISLVLVVIPLGSVISTPEDTAVRSTATFAALDLGYGHSCAITTAGNLMCWGENESYSGYGSLLGVGEYPDESPIPLNVDLGGASSYISASENTTCAVTSGGLGYCWGDGEDGQLGDGLYDNSFYPVAVSGEITWSKISTGEDFTCGMNTDGAAYCWGDDSYGYLGNGTSLGSSSTPSPVFNLDSGVTDISSGNYHTCALVSGGVKCWGYNSDGQLGDNSASGTSSQVPVDVSGLTSGVAAISCGDYFTCALIESDGSVKCWGNNFSGELGNGENTDSPVPVTVLDETGLSTLTNIISISGGTYHTCAVTNTGAAYCWGDNYGGQLGVGTEDAGSNIPLAVHGLSSGINSISAGGYHTCALMDTGSIKCWGDNDYGELGTGDWVNRLEPGDNVLTGRGYIYARFYNSSSQTTGFVASAAYSSTDLESTPVVVNTGYSNGYINELFPPPGTYYILGFVDVNGNGAYDEGEAYAWYDDDDTDEEPNAATISEGEYLELSPMIYIYDPIAGSISGTVTCDSPHTVFVDLYVDNTTPPPENSTQIACGDSYSFDDLPDGTYYVGAWIDLDESGGGPPDEGEPYAWYGEPTAVTIIDGETKEDIDITIDVGGYSLFLPLILR